MDEFSKRLVAAMRRNHMTVSSLSKKTGLNMHTIYSYISPEKYGGNRNPRLENLEALCTVLGISMDWLCDMVTEQEMTPMHVRKEALTDIICKLRDTMGRAQVSQQNPKASRRLINDLIARYELDEIGDISDDFILGFIYAGLIADNIVCEERDAIQARLL